MEWLLVAIMAMFAIVLHSPSEPENKESDDRHNIGTKS